MSDSLQERCARAAYEAAMTMRGDSLSPACVWESLPHRWQLIYRVQARAVLDLLDAEAMPESPLDQDALDFGEPATTGCWPRCAPATANPRSSTGGHPAGPTKSAAACAAYSPPPETSPSNST